MVARITDTDRGMRARMAALAQRGVVRVGILQGLGAEDVNDDGMTLVEIAAANEFGVPGHIPQRSFIRGTVDAKRGEIRGVQRAVAKQIAAGKIALNIGLSRIGAAVKGTIQARIASSIPPENAPSTVERKGSTTTLIDTGHLRSSIAYELEVA